MHFNNSSDAYTGYNDLSSNAWYANNIGYVLSKGYMKGYGDSSFKPNENITRGEFAATICRYKNINLAVILNKNLPLTDLDDKWYENYAKALNVLGIVTGYEDNTFKGDICDMESSGIVLTCEMNNVPCLFLKAVSDGLSDGALGYFAELKEASLKCLTVVSKIIDNICK